VEGHTSAAATLHAHVARARTRLIAAGITPEEADLDARLLAQQALGWDATHFLREITAPPPHNLEPLFEDLLRRRIAREPMAYIRGSQEFWNLIFEVTPDVLIPRPETEGIVEAVLEHAPRRSEPTRIADACTGSGCLAVVLATLFQAGRVVASDVSPAALQVARRNAQRHDVAARISFVQSDLLARAAGPFDLIVSNPPYVPETERLNLPPEVRDHEPGLALFAGPAGLTVIERLVHEASACLSDDGLLVFEFGFEQESGVMALLNASANLRLVEMRPDLQSIPRTAVAIRTRH
jgi:release factor glutamine methyltransferase